MPWLVVVPVKPLPLAKTRLRGVVPDVVHGDLVLAMARDTIAAALACGQVTGLVVVSDDPLIRRAAEELGASGVPDKPDAGLNAAVTFGAAGAPGPVAALAADLAALRPADLAAALDAAAGLRRRAFVADTTGTGTVLLTAPAGVPLEPRFGVDSAAAHRRSGALPLDGSWPSLRRDVDTPADLAEATALGLGPATAALLSAPPVASR